MKFLIHYLLLGLLIFAFTSPGQLQAQNANLVAKGPEHDARMQWWRDARFGLFIHWGLYSITGGVWKGETARKDYAEWSMHNFQIPQDEYSQLAKQFNPTLFNADEWAQLAEDAGMGYFVLTTKHHDGFAMYDSEISDYNVVDATPFKRDVFAELAEAFRKRDMKACAYYSQDLDWSVDQGGAIVSYNTWDFKNPEPEYDKFDKYLREKSLPQIEELATKYGDVGLFWFDFPRMVNKERGKLVHDTVRKHLPNAIVNGRICTPQGSYADYLVPGDNGFFSSPQPADWECCATMDESWGYKPHAHAKRTGIDIIRQLSTTVAAGGNLLLNIGPKPDGTIPQRQVGILKKIGVWMKHNKEAIHGNRANPFGEFFSWGLCTVKQNQIYLHISEWEADGDVILPRLKNKVTMVEVLGAPDRKLKWSHENGGELNIKMAGESVHPASTVIKVTCEGDSLDIAPLQLTETNELIELNTSLALSIGQKMRNLRHMIRDGIVVTNLSEGHSSERLRWQVQLEKPGTFEIIAHIETPSERKYKDRTVTVEAGKGNSVSTALSGSRISGTEISLGTISIDQSGLTSLSLGVKGGKGNPVYLKGLTLKRQS